VGGNEFEAGGTECASLLSCFMYVRPGVTTFLLSSFLVLSSPRTIFSRLESEIGNCAKSNSTATSLAVLVNAVCFAVANRVQLRLSTRCQTTNAWAHHKLYTTGLHQRTSALRANDHIFNMWIRPTMPTNTTALLENATCWTYLHRSLCSSIFKCTHIT
jgi:hypothetical protein